MLQRRVTPLSLADNQVVTNPPCDAQGRPLVASTTVAADGTPIDGLPPGRAAAAASVPVVLSTEDAARVYPNGAIPINGKSAVVANAAAVATLDSDAGRTTYITGFEVTGGGATSGLLVDVTVAGLIGGTITYVYAAAVGALVANTPLLVNFSPPLPASAPDTDIVVTVPALGAGNTKCAVVAHGFKV